MPLVTGIAGIGSAEAVMALKSGVWATYYGNKFNYNILQTLNHASPKALANSLVLQYEAVAWHSIEETAKRCRSDVPPGVHEYIITNG